ncbi:DUF262 domain-containing protein [Kitasatospora sp. NPDC004745]|uniref:DUF262 domain-containing protein n=1 Tax=Kitasatospora sp. NPDC004745 TaxID=3364019 RepID=UPI0036B3EE3D
MKMEARKMALDKAYKRRGRYDIPDWQRDEVWPLARKQLLIDSILNGWKLPKFYFAKTSNDPDEFDVVDGQQRLAAIWEFFEGTLRLSEESAAEFGGATYHELPDVVTDRFDDFEIEYDEITEASDDDIQEFFQRLQGGMILTAAEKLNAVNSGMTKFARKLAKHPFFTEKVAIRDTRKAYFDIASKVVAVEIEGLEARLRYDDLKRLAESQASFSENSNVALRIVATLDYLNRAFPGQSSVLRNRSTIQSFITLTTRLVAAGRADGMEVGLCKFFEGFGADLSRQNELGTRATDRSFLEFQRTLSANVKSGPGDRHVILLRKLMLSNSSWVEALGPENIAASGISVEIERLGRRVQDLVAARNDEYAAKNGSDLFKITNKTSAGLARCRDVVTDFKSYSNFIGDLYFLFREGPGQRLAGNVPPSFEDVNLLRTGLQHDVDHGKAGAVAGKRIKIGQTFAKYSGGETAPSTLDPTHFPMVQAALLREIAADLAGLAV